MMSNRVLILTLAATLFFGVISVCGQQPKDIVFTTKSPEAKSVFMEGLSKFDMLDFDGARELFKQAVELDPEFAMGYYFWAFSAATTAAFEERLARAVELAGNITEPERLLISSAQAGNDDKAALARERLERVVALLPEGKRAHASLGNFHYGQQEWSLAEAEYRRVIEIDPSFAPVYNQLGYLLSNLERYPEAIEALQKYSELKPEDPNPHDSMGEIYLWMSDYDNSIKEYSKSLELDPNFIVSIAGIGHNHILKGEFEKARAKYDEILEYAQSVADTTTSTFWIAVSYLHENKYDKALEVMENRLKFADAHENIFQKANINGLMGAIYEEKGDFDKALRYTKKMRKIADMPEIGEGNREGYIRFAAFNEALVYARQGEMDKASASIEEFQKSADASKDRIAMKNVHGLKGIAAYWNKDYRTAIGELRQANLQDPYSKYYLGLSLEGAGQKNEAKKVFAEVAGFNRNGLNYGFVRSAAKKKL